MFKYQEGKDQNEEHADKDDLIQFIDDIWAREDSHYNGTMEFEAPDFAQKILEEEGEF
jgi:Cft2 family RNA processing exonuclease